MPKCSSRAQIVFYGAGEHPHTAPSSPTRMLCHRGHASGAVQGLCNRLGFQTKGNSWPKSISTPMACSELISLLDVAGGSIALWAGRGLVSSAAAGEKERGTVVV